MTKFTEKTIIRSSLAILITVGCGLVSFTTYLVMLGTKTEANAVRIDKVERKQDAIEEIRTDIAVIKTKMQSIENKLDRK